MLHSWSCTFLTVILLLRVPKSVVSQQLIHRCLNSVPDFPWSIATQVDPCEDFSAYVCGGFKPEVPVHVGKVNRLDLLRKPNMRVIKSVLEGNASRPIVQKAHEVAGHRNLQKLQALYSSCMNETRIAKVGRQPLLDVIQQIITLFPVKGSPFEHLQVSTKVETSETTGRNDTSTTDPFTIDPQALSITLAYFNQMGLESIASIKVRRESVSGIESFELHSDAQGPFSEYDYEAEHETFYSGAEKDSIANVAKTLNLLMMPDEEDTGSRNTTDAQSVSQKWKDAAKDALLFASRLDKIHRKPKFQPVVPWEMSNISKAVNWTLVLERALPPDVQLPLLVLPVGSLVLDMDILLELMFMRSTQTTSALQIQSYFVWRAVHQMIQYIDPTYSQFLRSVIKSKKTERSQYCTEFVNSAMGRMVGPYFAQQIHLEPTMARDMIRTIQIKLVEVFKGVSWVPLPNRAREIHKMGKALTLVGVDNGTIECLSALEYFYKSYAVHPDDFFGNWIRFIRWHRANTFRGLKGFDNFGEEVSDALPQDVIIRHDLEGGKIQVPVGMLQPPFFSNDFQDYDNFASIGSMIAQEYARGLDFGEGPLAKTIDMFCEDSEHCEKLRYNRDNYVRSAFDPDVPGLSEGELAARSIGLQIAFEAWNSRSPSQRNSTRHCKSNVPLTGRHYTPEELFFITYGRSLCEIQRLQYSGEVHLCKWRINGPLANFPSFSKAFNCKLGTPMNPEKSTMDTQNEVDP